MLTRIDIRAELEDLGVRKDPIFTGIRPTIKIKEGYLTTGIIEFDGEKKRNGMQDVVVMFISPKYYPNSVWEEKRMEVYEGSKVIGYITVTEIVNPVLDLNREKWVLLDGRDIHTMQQFFEQVQKQMVQNDYHVGYDLNSFNDILWGGYGVHEYQEPLHIVWIFAKESREYLGEENFNMIIGIVNNHESANKYLEVYEEHAFE